MGTDVSRIGGAGTLGELVAAIRSMGTVAPDDEPDGAVTQWVRFDEDDVRYAVATDEGSDGKWRALACDEHMLPLHMDYHDDADDLLSPRDLPTRADAEGYLERAGYERADRYLARNPGSPELTLSEDVRSACTVLMAGSADDGAMRDAAATILGRLEHAGAWSLDPTGAFDDTMLAMALRAGARTCAERLVSSGLDTERTVREKTRLPEIAAGSVFGLPADELSDEAGLLMREFDMLARAAAAPEMQAGGPAPEAVDGRTRDVLVGRLERALGPGRVR